LPKKTVTAIIDSGNDYVIQVKGNQAGLLRSIKATVEGQEALSTRAYEERSRGRHERRVVEVFSPPPSVSQHWTGLRRVIHIERQVARNGKQTHTDHYYISSVCSNQAEVFAVGIRGHWSIENRLHWVKDVIQHEDDAGIKEGNGIETLSILKNIAMNISRELGFDSIKGATIHFASNVKELLDYFRT
jgi:predicted transposase YbfD/YdcC